MLFAVTCNLHGVINSLHKIRPHLTAQSEGWTRGLHRQTHYVLVFREICDQTNKTPCIVRRLNKLPVYWI